MSPGTAKPSLPISEASRAVISAPDRTGAGFGRRMIEAALADAGALGVRRMFALTYEKEFFLGRGFEVIDRESLPEKVWRECIACPKVDACDEIAMIRRLPAP